MNVLLIEVKSSRQFTECEESKWTEYRKVRRLEK